MSTELVDLTLCVHAETPKAWLVSDDGDRDRAVWLPKSQCERHDRVGVEKGVPVHEFAVPEWLAAEKELA